MKRFLCLAAIIFCGCKRYEASREQHEVDRVRAEIINQLFDRSALSARAELLAGKYGVPVSNVVAIIDVFAPEQSLWERLDGSDRLDEIRKLHEEVSATNILERLQQMASKLQMRTQDVAAIVVDAQMLKAVQRN